MTRFFTEAYFGYDLGRTIRRRTPYCEQIWWFVDRVENGGAPLKVAGETILQMSEKIKRQESMILLLQDEVHSLKFPEPEETDDID